MPARLLGAGYAVALGILVLNAFVTFRNLQAISAGWRDVARTHDAIVSLGDILSNLRDAETGQRGFLLTGDEGYLRPYRDALAVVDRSIARAESMTARDDVQRARLRGIEGTIRAKLDELRETIRLRRMGGLRAALAVVRTDRGSALMEELRRRIGAMVDDEAAHRAQGVERLRVALNRTIFTFTLTSVLALGLLLSVHYVNERGRRQQRVAARWFSTALRSIGDAVIATDATGLVTFMNPTAEALTGWVSAAAEGRPLEEVFAITNESTGQRVENPVARVLRDGHVVGLANHTELTSRDGTRRPIEDSAAPIRDEGEIRGVVLVFRDVTEARRVEQERERLMDVLRENDRLKDEFLAMLAHELRNPLSAIGNAVTLSTRGGLKEHADWAMDVINRQMRHLTRLIDDLLDVSRITRGKIELRRERVDLTPILAAALEAVGPLVEERKHSLTADFPEGDLWLDADPTRLEQIVVNLLTNAAKYTEAGGRIRLEARADGPSVVISVEDSGVGIPPELLPRIFDLFTQGDRTLARSEGGLGIGLTVVRNLVELHGGSISVESAGPGRGTTFRVRLPRAERPPAPPRAASPNGNARGEARRGARILVVDDNVDTARGLSRLLKLLGHQVRTSHDGPEAIEAARAHAPDFVLLDIGLPGMDGYQVAAALRNEECCREAVIIAISGYGRDEDRRRSAEVGIDHHLVKPIDPDALISLISEG